MIVEFSPYARGDLKSIAIELAWHNPEAAFQLVALIEQATLSLEESPYRGRAIEWISDTRRLLVGKFLLIYRVYPTKVSILRIIHGARDIRALLLNEDRFEEIGT